MASLKFYLKRPKSKEETSIYFMLNFGSFEMIGGKKKYLPLKYYTTESVNPKYWNFEKGRITETKKFPQYPEFNARLDDIENKALNTLRRLENDDIKITHDLLRKEFDRLWKDSKDLTNENFTEKDFFEFINHSIENAIIEEGTKKSYRRTRKDLEEFKLLHSRSLTFMDINMEFYYDFVAFLEDKLYAPNTIGCRIKNLKTFLRNASERGIEVNQSYKLRSFTKPRENSTSIYLNEAELETMSKLDLSMNLRLDKVRDLFLIASYTGLRYSDLSRLSSEHITADNTIEIVPQKTKDKVSIPIHWKVLDVLRKYKNDLPKVPSSQKFNDYIKEVAKLAGIDETIHIEKRKGRKTVEKIIYKYDLVTAHTARRSFATNAFIAGVPVISIMMITGHKTESAFMKYIKITKEENAKKMLEHTFFKK